MDGEARKQLLLKGKRAQPRALRASDGESTVVEGEPAPPAERPKGALAPGVADGGLPTLSSLPSTIQESFAHLTERQFEWLTFRLGLDSDDAACEMTGADELEVMAWRGVPEFEALYQRALENKREAFRVLGTHLLPKALRVINRMLESDSIRANSTGLQYLLKTQALLDQPQKDQGDQITRLLDTLRAPGHVVPVDIRPRE